MPGKPDLDNVVVSIHVPLAEHDMLQQYMAAATQVSIHVPLAEHDRPGAEHRPRFTGFNSRAPRGARLGGL